MNGVSPPSSWFHLPSHSPHTYTFHAPPSHPHLLPPPLKHTPHLLPLPHPPTPYTQMSSLASTSQVWSNTTGHRYWQATPLSAVPPLPPCWRQCRLWTLLQCIGVMWWMRRASLWGWCPFLMCCAGSLHSVSMFLFLCVVVVHGCVAWYGGTCSAAGALIRCVLAVPCMICLLSVFCLLFPVMLCLLVTTMWRLYLKKHGHFLPCKHTRNATQTHTRKRHKVHSKDK